jgi:hypothetical protein
MPLAIRCKSHHFAPSVESVRLSHVVAPPRPVIAHRVDITDRHGAPVYQYDWIGGGPAAFAWDGEDNMAAKTAGVAKQFVDPLRSPYRIRLTVRVEGEPPLQPRPPEFAQDDGVCLPCGDTPPPTAPAPGPPPIEELSAEATVRVLYRELKLRRLTWREAYTAVTNKDGSFPDGGTEDEQKTWLCYRLNELGYPAGPICDPPDPLPIERALYRYTQSHPDTPRINHYETVTRGPGGANQWGWKALWDAQFGALAQLCTGAATQSGAALLTALRNGDAPRKDPIENPGAFEPGNPPTRAILDCDIFYINREYSAPDIHAEYDAEFLNPLCLPLVAEVLLVSQNDADGAADGVAAPRAVGPVSIEWLALDPPEDLGLVPPPNPRNRLQSAAKRYLGDTRQRLAARPDDPRDAGDNCPSDRGGRRDTNLGMRSYFQRVDHVGGAQALADPLAFATTAHHDQADPRESLGLAAAWFRGSYIAGDNYVLAARLALDDALKADHQQLAGLARCFAPVTDWLRDAPPDPLSAQSGEITVWRRHHVLREVLWGPEDLPAIQWFDVIDNFRAAHVILVPPAEGPIALADLLHDDAPTRQRFADALINHGGPAIPEFQARAALATVQREGMYPLPYRTLADFEASPLHLGAVGATFADRVDKYHLYLRGQETSWPKYAHLVTMAQELRAAFDARGHGPGLIVLRARYMPRPNFQALLPAPIYADQRATCDAFEFNRTIAAGLDYGVVCLDDGSTMKFTDGFFVSHELSHCLFGAHAFEPPTVADHDEGDRNCIMYYNSANDKGNFGIVDGWAVRSLPDSYDFVIGLAKTDVKDEPPYGAFVGAFTAETRRRYAFSGTLAEVQAALRALRYVPDRGLDPELTLKLTVDSNVLPKPQVQGRTLPYTVRIKVGKKPATPFADVTLAAQDLRSNEPRFCGKCLLKLRGWRIRDTAGAVGAAAAPQLPARTRARPVRPVMSFERYQVSTGAYKSIGPHGEVQDVLLGPGTRDPRSKKIPLGPYSFLHIHKLTWSSSSGRLGDLQGVRTREYVTFRGDTQAAPFSEYADPDREFFQGGGEGQHGFAQDDHSVTLPSLMCAWPLQAGELIGEQWYQYSLDGVTWTNIEHAAFLLEKRVYQTPDGWVFQFCKRNWAPHNPVPFVFDVRYRIGPQPLSAPRFVDHHNNKANVLQTGTRRADRQIGVKQDVTLAELAPWLAPKPWK